MTSKTAGSLSLLDPALIKPALWGAFAKLSPRVQWRNPVMFVVYIGSILTTLLWLHAIGFAGPLGAPPRGGMRAPAVSAKRGWSTCHFHSIRCSTTGPRASAGT